MSTKKITEIELSRLVRQEKTDQEIAQYFGASISTVRNKKCKWGLSVSKERARKKKARETMLKTWVFKEVKKHRVEVSTMVKAIEGAVHDNIQIKDRLKDEIEQNSIEKTTKGKDTFRSAIKIFFEAQDKMIERIQDYRDLQRDLYSLSEVQKFMNGIMDVYQIMPVEYRRKLHEELNKRGIAHLNEEQIVSPIVERNGQEN
jgi:hypothetical protein